MFRLIKWLFGFLSVLAMLILAAALIVPRVVNPNDYRDDIADLVKQETGRDLTLGGDLSVSVFPWLGVRAYDVALSQPEGFTKGNMLQVGEVDLKVKLLPLFQQQVEVATVVLKQPTIHIITNKEGVSSLDGLSGSDAEDQEDKSDDPKYGPEAAFALVVQGVHLEDGNIIWDDLQTEQLFQVRNLEVKTGNLLGEELVPLALKGELLDSSTPEIVAFDMSGTARIDMVDQQVAIRSLQTNIERGDMELKLGLDEAVVKSDLSIVVNGLTAHSETLETEMGAAQISTFVPSASFSPASGILKLSAMQGSGKLAERQVLLESSNIIFDSGQQTLVMPTLKVQSDDLQVSVNNLQGRQIIDAPQIMAVLNVQPFNAQKLLNELDIDYQPTDEQALNKLGLSTRLSGSLDEASLSNIKLLVDNTTLTGNAFVQNFEQPAISFDLKLDELDMDRYMPIDEEAEQNAPEAASKETIASALAVPMALFKDLNANGSFKAGRLKSSGAELENIDVSVTSTPGRVVITPNAQLYEGSIAGKIEYTESDDGAQLRIENNIDLVDLSRLLTAVDITDQLSGIGTLNIDLLVEEVAGQQTNSGTIKLLAKNGALRKIDFRKGIDKANQYINQLNELRGKEKDSLKVETDENGEGETRFTKLLGTFDINDFVVSNKDFVLTNPLFNINGEGEIDILKGEVNYLTKIVVSKSVTGEVGRKLEKFKGKPLPLRVVGPITDPNIIVKTKDIYSLYLKPKTDEKVDKYIERKLGVENGSQLSSKDLLRQAILNEVQEKYGDNEQTQPEAPVNQQPEAVTVENQPVADGNSENQAAPVENVSAQQPAEPELTSEQRKEKAKDELKEQLIQGALDSIFGPAPASE